MNPTCICLSNSNTIVLNDSSNGGMVWLRLFFSLVSRCSPTLPVVVCGCLFIGLSLLLYRRPPTVATLNDVLPLHFCHAGFFSFFQTTIRNKRRPLYGRVYLPLSVSHSHTSQQYFTQVSKILLPSLTESPFSEFVRLSKVITKLIVAS